MNLEYIKNLQDQKITGSALLISGCCIGAGMLGLPITTGLAGFIPSSIILFIVWFYMFSTSKLLIEANSWFPKQEVNLITLTGRILGKPGQIIVWVLFAMLFYSLLAAYFIKGGDILYSTILQGLPYMKPESGTLILVIISFVTLNFRVMILDKLNYLFMIILFMSFILLLKQSYEHINIQNLIYYNNSNTLFLVPFLVTSFGYHNLIASIRNYLEYDDTKVAHAVFYGSIIPLIVYFIWIFVILGIIPFSGENSIINSFINNQIATEPLVLITGSDLIYTFAMIFSFSAIITSIFGQGLSLIDFVRDGLNLPKEMRVLANVLTIVPPYIMILINPNIFFTCLGVAGGIAAVILYGFLPSFIVYQGRYKYKLDSKYISFKSKKTLIIIMIISILIMFIELTKILGIYTILI